MTQEEFDKAIQVLWNTVKDLQKENEELKELCNKYEEEHNTTFKEWQKDIQANKKAIEYIKSNTIHYTRYLSLEKTIIPKLELQDYQYNVLLNILQGESDK